MTRSAGPLLLLGLLGCGPPPEVVHPAELTHRVAGASTLVVVYSRSGHTARAGRALADTLGADYVRIQGSGKEGGSFFSTPSWTRHVAVTPERLDLRPYRLILLGTPIWYWKPSALIRSFAENHDLTGKEVILFYTNEGGVSASALAEWRRVVEGRGARVRDTFLIDRKKLAPGESEAAAAQRIAGERRGQWLGPASTPTIP